MTSLGRAASQGDPPLVAVSPQGAVQRRLANGLHVNLMSQAGEPQRVSVRLLVPGGRLREDPAGPGALLLGARTLQEGGAFLDRTREEVGALRNPAPLPPSPPRLIMTSSTPRPS